MGWVALVTLLLAVQVLLATALGVLVGRWRSRKGDASLDSETAAELLGQLQAVSEQLRHDVGRHTSQVSQHNKQLRDAADHDGAMSSVVAQLVEHILEDNENLQRRLLEAENRLSQQEQLISSHAQAASTDPLTGLPNRRALDEQLDRRLAETARDNTPLSLILIDIDHFKQLNDRHGHLAGDHVLREAAEVLNSTMRDMDMVSRFGGEEFAIVLPKAALQPAAHVAERLRKLVDEHRFDYQAQEFSLTISLGTAEAQPGESAASLLGRADEALYAAKTAGRNCTWIHDGQQCQSFAADGAPPQAAVEGDDVQWQAIVSDLQSSLASLKPGGDVPAGQ